MEKCDLDGKAIHSASRPPVDVMIPGLRRSLELPTGKDSMWWE